MVLGRHNTKQSVDRACSTDTEDITITGEFIFTMNQTR